MLTVAEAAVRACVSEGVIRGWISSGQLPHYRLGMPGRRGKIVIEVEDLDGVLASFKVGKKKPEPPKAPAPRPPVLKHLSLRPS